MFAKKWIQMIIGADGFPFFEALLNHNQRSLIPTHGLNLILDSAQF